MRLNNYISSTGLCSRRQADKLIKLNKVTVNGEIPSIGYDVKPEDIVEVNGQILNKKQVNVYLVLNKPIRWVATILHHHD